ncbi:Hypothetical protein, putative [Bodo saltans]|uniref:FYVE-type domain-containing protein n=1 Tax=Bodo saltans TaxID=75058 RepID=A0A0S4JFH0_BODSA|nr:Hypothetical protein, putative [Bodo saltans]|eukprot:CUG88182.1 Hypothetical protein, putative [Bodo saltans]
MGIPLSLECHPSSSSGEQHHRQDPVPSTSHHHTTAPTSFVGTLLHAHRCHVCGDVKVPRPFQTSCGTKTQRTCRQCNRQVCVDCYKSVTTTEKQRGILCVSGASKFVCAVCSSTAPTTSIATVPRRVVTIRSLMTLVPHNDTGTNNSKSVWALICSYAFESSQAHRQRGGRHLFRAWGRSWASSTPMLLECTTNAAATLPVTLSARQHPKTAALIRSPPPPSRTHELKSRAVGVSDTTPTPRKRVEVVLADDATSSDDDVVDERGSPVARIPDFSAALEETSGSIFCALNVNTPSSITSNIKSHHLNSGAKCTTTTPQQRTTVVIGSSGHQRVSAVSQSPFAVKGSARRPATHPNNAQCCSSTSPLPRSSAVLSARKDFLAVVPSTPRTVGLSPRPHDPSSTPSYLRPTEGSHRRASIACPSMSPLVSTRRSTIIPSTPRPANHSNAAAQPTHLAAFGRTDTSTVSPLVFRAPRPRSTNDENVAQTLFA